jgi:DNA-binding NarL/FixJ family response regulator
MNQETSAARVRVLTPREIEIARLVAQGKRNREIARELALAVSTVETHLKHIFAKLHLRSRTDLARWALENEI